MVSPRRGSCPLRPVAETKRGALDDKLMVSQPSSGLGAANGQVDPANWLGRYRDPSLTALELQALEWLDGFYELEHLLATRKWAIKLRPHASLELRLAALVHDAERHFPGGPTNTPPRFDDPSYLFAHSIRSGEVVDSFLVGAEGVDDEFRYRVRCLVLRHEVGGDVEADILQAADSLSFLETLPWLTVQWVRTGRYAAEMAKGKHSYMLKRMRPPEALAFGLPLYEEAIGALDNPDGICLDGRLEIASDYRLLLGMSTSHDGVRETNERPRSGGLS
jgi:hypothetical protein